MKIEKNFFGEFIEECGYPVEAERNAGKADEDSGALKRKFAERIFAARKERLLEKRAEGKCMPVNRFYELVQKGTELAERIGLDFLAQTDGGEGIIVLTGESILISKDESPRAS